MLENPWTLCLLILPIAYLFLRKNRYYYKVPYLAWNLSAKREVGRGSFWVNLSEYLIWAACLFLIGAAADVSLEYEERFEKNLVHNYILINDGSGSMVESAKENGVGVSLTALLAGNRAFLAQIEALKRPDGEKDFVGAIAFSNNSFVVSYLTNELSSITEKLEIINWRKWPLGNGTEINEAIWTGLLMIFMKNADYGGTKLSKEELLSLTTHLMGADEDFQLDIETNLAKKILALRKEVVGTQLILFTDGIVGISGTPRSMSVIKLLKLCQKLGARVHFLSVETIPARLNSAIQETGGKALFLNKLNEKELEKVYAEIAAAGAAEKLVEARPQNKSLSFIFAGLGMALLTLALMLRNNKVGRSLTRV